MRTPLRLLATMLAPFLALPASAEVSHHQGGASPGQVTLAGVDRLAGEPEAARADVRIFSSFLHASKKLDDAGERVDLAGGGSIRNLGLNAYGELRVAGGLAASILTGVQRLDIDDPDAPETIYSLADTLLAARYTIRVARDVGLAGVVSVKLPGTYPESEATGAKQIDQETKVLVVLERLGTPRLSLVAGIGYRVRFSTIQDELTPTIVVPFRAGPVTVAAALTGGIAVGAGAEMKDSLAPGATVAVRISRTVEVAAAYYQTVYGHNVVAAHIATLGVGGRL